MKLRSNSTTFFPLLFIILFLLLGIAGIGIILLEQYAGICIIVTESERDRVALYAASSFIGVFGLCASPLMFYLLRERRDPDFDRRQQSKSIDFSNRRQDSDRRTL
jgi:hypothetical protein